MLSYYRIFIACFYEPLNSFTLKLNKTCQPLHNRQHL
uniref:Uncharacterized protein n=1 Tax=Siphoviridae sp. ctsoB6 TaxID=2826487 RepID=A0A8S5QPQ0_9CAUD|nr:MAG TPA: hypothetical protein [Siphoviridae sp. ctsoB6]